MRGIEPLLVITRLAQLCAVLVVLSAIGPWHIRYQARDSETGDWSVSDEAWVTSDDGGDASPLVPGRLGYRTPERLLLPVAGLLPLVPLATTLGLFSWPRHERRQAFIWAAGCFVLLLALMAAITDVPAASLGVGAWDSGILGGYRPYRDRGDVRQGWGWGAGLAWWSALGGLGLCLAGWWRARKAAGGPGWNGLANLGDLTGRRG